jgi:hypothetical protein
MKHLLPVVVGYGVAHTAAQQLQRLRLIENESEEIMSIAQGPRGADVEAERKDLAELISRNIFSANDWTAWAVVVVAERKTTHGVTMGTERQHKESPASAGLGACGALCRKG